MRSVIFVIGAGGAEMGRTAVVTEKEAKKRVAASLMATGLSYRAALPAAGLPASPNIIKNSRFQETMEDARERLRNTEGYRLDDTLGWYKKMSEDVKMAPTVRLMARREMARLLGQEVPKKVEVNSRQEMLSVMASLTKVSPEMLIEAEVEEAENDSPA
jgi:hypothetical protein